MRLTGRKVQRKDAPWLECVLGKPGLIGTGVYQQIADQQGLNLSMSPDAGLIPDFSALRGPSFDPGAVHPRIRHFYEHAALYHLEVWSEVYFAGKFVLWLLVEFISRRMDQLNFPISSLEVAKGMTSEIMELRERSSGRLAHTGWLVRSKEFDRAVADAAREGALVQRFGRISGFEEQLALAHIGKVKRHTQPPRGDGKLQYHKTQFSAAEALVLVGRISKRPSVVARAMEDVDGVGQQLGQGVERLDGALGAAGQVEDQRAIAHYGDSAGQHRRGCLLRAFAAHLFGEAGNHFFADFKRRFRRVVARAKAGAAGGEDQVRLARVDKLPQVHAHLFGIIGAFLRAGNFPSEFAAALHDGGAGKVHALAAGHGIADGEDRDAQHGHQFEGTASRLASSIKRIASISRPVVLRVVVVLVEALAALKSISNSPSVQRSTL